jgi:hypothetical protein
MEVLEIRDNSFLMVRRVGHMKVSAVAAHVVEQFLEKDKLKFFSKRITRIFELLYL